MGKSLIIAEKPSVAADIARALGGFNKEKDYFENDQYVISSAVGHLLELAVPEGVEVKRGKWSFANLPVIPPHFELKPIEKTESRLKMLVRLVKRKDVEALVNACDAGREGELIFRNLARHSKTQKPVRRLWLQSMTPAAIRDGFTTLRDGEALEPLADAAICRSEADWLVGINGTRAMTAFNSKTGGFHLTTVGRVQTPTLAIVVEREERIRKFVARDYWEVFADFGAEHGEYRGRWFDEKFAKAKEGDSDLRAERIWTQTDAEAIRDKCAGKPGTVTEESKPTTQRCPLLFDLTSLQREANSRLGFSAQRTLQIAQALYERHKAITYPRTDSRALPEDYGATVKQTLGALEGSAYGTFANQILKQGWVAPSDRRIFNNARISDHFAIIPTPAPPKKLASDESRLYDMITRRFLAVFYPPAEFRVTTRITRVEGEPFKTEGKVMVNPGWLVVYGRDQRKEEEPDLVKVSDGEIVKTLGLEVLFSQTKPPARFSEATLLSAMEGAGKLVDDEELKAAMREKGLGTPATRASIIEGLLHEKYLLRQGRELHPTAKAFSLMALLRGLGVPELISPELTGDWEFKLKQMERKQLPRETFMREIAGMTREIVRKAKEHEHDTIPGEFGTLQAPCPKCGGEVHETYKKFQCRACDFALWKIVAGRQFELEEIETLLTERLVGPLTGFRSKIGRPFAASIRLTDEFVPSFEFESNGKQANGEEKEEDFTGKEPVGKCPKCGNRVYEGNRNYLCEKRVGENPECKFRSGRTILNQPVEPGQMTKLLSTGKTDLLDKFISRRGRPFKAFLVLGKEGKVEFEFEPSKKGPRQKNSEGSKPDEPGEKIDFADKVRVGDCPRCGSGVFVTETAYLCEKAQADEKPCKFRVGKEICQRAVEPEEVSQLLKDKKTGLLKDFISKRGRPFSAWLVLEGRGKVGFEFPEREPSS